jgi:hypothetical protein
MLITREKEEIKGNETTNRKFSALFGGMKETLVLHVFIY